MVVSIKMNSVVIFLGIVALATAGPLNIHKKIDPKLDWRIVGGSVAAQGQFPYQISLRLAGSHFCGGSIITPNKILTAAHCVQGVNPNSLKVMAGINQLNSLRPVYSVRAISVNPQWDSFRLLNDLAVLTLASNIIMNTGVQPITLESNDVGGGVPSVLSGWGLTSYPGNIPNNLQYINLFTITVQECQQRLVGMPVGTSQVCTFTRFGQGACQGDSGGPLAAGGKQIGIVSWGIPCAIGNPDVFTRVSSFTDWIAQQ